jgi:ligand-binding SRPBCC domain-containing protein
VPYTLERSQWLPRPLPEVFAFFADPANLNELTPSSLHFQTLTPRPILMRPGALIDYRLRLRGVPMRWRTRITAFDPPHSFIDEQLKGPYAKWLHTHTFAPLTIDGVEGTRVTDRVEYDLPRWPGRFLCDLVHRTLVAPDLDRIFTYRHKVLATRFPAPTPAPAHAHA